ncbi:MAG TPA: YbhB/YbcL family Raf kinase inhibitor-like protein [Rhabdochlamydiaceae bacterium]|nr:YbhB/YbcL family Raf kinase inhibitor-like protein [Rhabdochlamydiaceae bacterium]
MKLISSAFKQGEKIPQKYTCEGFNWNPPLQFLDVPRQTKSLVLIIDDPDVPETIRADGLWIHWIVYDIPPTTTIVKEHSVAPGTPGKGTNGRTAYMGPCPPDTEHRYFFKLFALDAFLDLPKGLTIDEIQQKMEGHVIEKAELMGRYELLKKRMT